MESAQRESEQRLRAVLESAVEGIITIDERGVVDSINPSACRIFGFGAAEVLGQNVSMLMPMPDRARHDGYLANYLGTGHAKVIGIGREVVGRRKDGSTFPMDLSVCEVRVGDRRMFTGFVRDISERRALEKAVEAAREQERLRIARELHDGLGQQLGGLLFLMNGLHRDLQDARVPQAEIAGQLGEELATALAQARNLAHELYSVDESPEGLASGLEALAGRISAEGAIACEFLCPIPVLIQDPAVASHLYRIGQEAVHNALKYSGARRIELVLERRPESVLLSIRDNGRGFTPQPGGSGLGFRTMEQRARLMSASLELRHPPEGGFVVSCEVPVVGADAATV